jgi:hypothetical protein
MTRVNHPIRALRRTLLLLMAFPLWIQPAGARLITVNTAAAFRSAVATLLPGDTVMTNDGQFDLGGVVEITTHGTPAQPVVIRARHTGRTDLRGPSRFLFQEAQHVLLEGFIFSGTDGPAVRLLGCRRVRISRNTFQVHERGRSSWVLVEGRSRENRIDHNVFQNKREPGNFITIEGESSGGYRVSQYDTIDHNHFRETGPRAKHVLEAISIGSADYSLSSGHTLLEHNLFERCDGDPEYISIRSSDNTIRYNTFRECLGSLSLRHGNRNTVDGNFIFGGGRKGMFTDSTGKTWTLGTGGVRFCGDSMVIVNNYMEELTGSGWDATLAATNGDADTGEGKPLTKHYRIRHAVIAFNTMVDNASGLEIGFDGAGFQNNRWALPPYGMVIANNIFVGKKDTLIRLLTSPLETTWSGNVAFATGGGVVSAEPIPGVSIVDPRLVRQDGWWRPGTGSPVLGAAEGAWPFMTHDIEGQPRKSRPDAGADEVSRVAPLNKPLSPTDVGPFGKD